MRCRPEFRFVRPGDYIGERCPDCDAEVYLVRGGGDHAGELRCHCGWPAPQPEWVRQLRRAQDAWDRRDPRGSRLDAPWGWDRLTRQVP